MCNSNKREKQSKGSLNILPLFQKLTPTQNVDLAGYEEALNFVFENKDIRNIAISGIYGSGKSSMIESYESKYPRKKFIHISLAHFSGNATNESYRDSEAQEKKDLPSSESIIEGKILNQLIQQIPSRRIPQTNFNTKSKMKKGKILLAILLLLVLITSVLFCWKFSAWQKYISDPKINFFSPLSFSANPDYRLAFYLLGILILGILGFYLFKAQHNKGLIKKLSVKGNEIEIFSESKDSYFDKYLNEVIYLFRRAKAKCIIFEDIDRFDNLNIFSRLREINTLVNARSGFWTRKKKTPIRFFYMIRDDLFTNKDRTKFFDFIIPIIPVIDGSNSYEKIVECLKPIRSKPEDPESSTELHNRFIREISLYIDDMRIVKNIVNEYYLFDKKLKCKSISLNPNKLFAIVTYKNLFPKDYAGLQLNNGFVYKIITKKAIIINKLTEELNNKLQEKKETLERYNNEVAQNEQEIDIIYTYKSRPGNISQAEWIKQKNTRKQDLVAYKENGKLSIEKEIAEIERQIGAIKSYQLAELLSISPRELITALFEEKDGLTVEIQSSPYFPLLRYLLESGYIDESYNDYMTFFYEGSLAVEDKNFLRAGIERINLEYNYKLKTPTTLLSNLDTNAFSKPYSLNYDLTEIILLNKKEDFIKTQIDYLRENKCFDYIQGYIEAKPIIAPFINAINKYWPDMFYEAYASHLSDDFLTKYSYLTLISEKGEIIKQVNVEDSLQDYISGCPTYLDQDNPDLDILGSAFQILDVMFTNLEISANTNKKLLDYVYENNLYKINSHNIQQMLKHKCYIDDPSEIMPLFFTHVLKNNRSPLLSYLAENIPTAFDVYFEMYTGKIADNSSISIEIMNNPDILPKSKERYLSRLKNKIIYIRKIINVEDKKLVVKCKAMEYSTYNVLDFYSAIGYLSPELIDFINSKQTKLNYSIYSNQYTLNQFEKDCISSDINISQYRRIFEELNTPIDNFNIDGLSREKISALVNSGKIQMNEANLKFLRANYPDEIIEFIHHNAIEYTNIVSFSPVLKNATETEVLLGCEEIPDDEKITFLDISDQNVSIQKKQYSDKLLESILTRHFETSDIPWLLLNYCTYSKMIQTIIVSVLNKHIDDVIPHVKEANDLLLDELIRVVPYKKQIQILESVAGHVSKERLCKILDIIHYDKISANLKGNYKRISSEPETDKVLRLLFDAGVIEEPEPSADGKYYKMIRYAE